VIQNLVALVKAGVKLPNGQPEMFRSAKSDDDSLFYQTQSTFAASEASTHDI